MIKRQGWKFGVAVLGAAAIASGAAWAAGMGGGEGCMHAGESKPEAHACMHAPDGDAATARAGPGMGGMHGMGGMQGMGGMHGMGGMQGMGGMHGKGGMQAMGGMHGKDGMGGKHGMGRMQAMHGQSGMQGPTGEGGHRGPGHDNAPGKADGGCHG